MEFEGNIQIYNGRPGKRGGASPALPCLKREGKKTMQKNMSMDERDNRDSRNEKLLAAMVLMVSWRLFIIVRILGYAAFVFPVFMFIGIINVVSRQEPESV